jgi:hypothetical protein
MIRSAILGAVSALLVVVAIVACKSPQQAGANTVTIAGAVCMADEAFLSIIPPSAVQQAAEDIALVCQDVPVAQIVAFIEGLVGAQGDAGVTSTAAYKPSPHVLAAHAARVAAFGSGK